jgi:hypothetical protein
VFQNIKLWEIASVSLLEQNLPGLLPLLPLTEDGNRREVVLQMFHRLQQADKKNLFVIGYRMALRMLKEVDQQWLEEMVMNNENSFTPLEIWEIFEGTWMQDAILEKYINWKIKQGKEQELIDRLVEKGLGQGLEQVVKQGLEQGEKRGLEQSLQAMRATLLSFVKTHFPDELVLANQQVGLIVTLSQAQELSDKLFVARTDDEVKAILLSIPHA